MSYFLNYFKLREEMKMEKGKFIYEGKAKQLYETDDKDLVIVHY